jgi:hypothetical protein
MATQLAPSSQKDKPIGFVLETGALTESHTLAIRPEDLSRSDPSRMTVQQALDGDGWIDNFGLGLGQISISGHTGWRPNQLDGLDWKSSFDKLNKVAFVDWHSARAAQAKKGNDPDIVRLIFADTLNGITSVVAPISFQLKRSKSRPLLMQYNIVLNVISRNAGDYGQYLLRKKQNVPDAMSGLDSLTNGITTLNAKMADAISWMDTNILAPIAAFTAMTERVMGLVSSAIAMEGKLVGTLAAAAMMISRAGANIFSTLGMIAGLPQRIKSQYMAVASIFTNFRCLMQNAFNLGKAIPDYSAFYGASVCSSTSGGRPLMPYSTTSSLVALAGGSVDGGARISPSSSAAMVTLSANDPVLAPLPKSTIANLAAAAAGVEYYGASEDYMRDIYGNILMIDGGIIG